MAFTRQRKSRHRSHDSGLSRVRTESAILESSEDESDTQVFRSHSRNSSPVRNSHSRPSSIPPFFGRNFATLGTNSPESFMMTYAITSPVASPVPLNFGVKKRNMGNSISSPMIYSMSAPVSPIAETVPDQQNPVPFLGNPFFPSADNSVPSPIPCTCIPKPVKVCGPISQSFAPRPVAPLPVSQPYSSLAVTLQGPCRPIPVSQPFLPMAATLKGPCGPIPASQSFSPRAYPLAGPGGPTSISQSFSPRPVTLQDPSESRGRSSRRLSHNRIGTM